MNAVPNTPRRLVLAMLALAALPAWAAPDEAALREAMVAYQKAWNTADVAAWRELVTADLLYEETFTTSLLDSRKVNSRERAEPKFLLGTRDFAFKWEPLRIRIKSDGSATVVARIVQTAGKSAFETNPAIARWRVEDERWKLFHYVGHQQMARNFVSTEGL